MAKQDTRNPITRMAILRKGGVHEKGKTAKRLQQKRQLSQLVDDYLTDDPETSFETALERKEKNGHGSGRFFALIFYIPWGFIPRRLLNTDT